MATQRTVKVRLEADPGPFVAGMMTARAAVKGLTNEIDTSNDRTAWLAQSILALGPALSPLGAAAVPVLSGLVTQMTLAAGAAGTAALAFNGVGDGLKALNEYQLEPTAANFEKMRLAMEKVGPDGAEFITFLDSIGPKFTDLQMVAREGMFPGMQEGLESFLDLLPRVRNIVSETAEAMGELSAQAGAGLAGEGFADFFDYMERTARPMLIEMGQTLGNFIEGIAAMIVAFEPLSADFSSGFLNMSESFSAWAHGLEDSSSFADFVDYVQQSVPKALDFLASLSDAFVEIIKAAAPVGDAMLPALTALFDVIGALAASPLGPVFLTAAAAMSLYGRAVALSSITTGGLGKVLGQSAYATAGLSKAFTSGLPPLNAFTNSMFRLGQAQQSQSLYTQATNKMMGGWLKTLAPAAAGVGLLAFAMSDLDDKAGLTNTSMGALLGSMAGLKGGAIGASIGLILDFRAANDQLEQSFERIDRSLARGIPGMETAKADIDATRESISDLIAVAGDKSMGGTLERAFSPQYWREAAQHFGDFSNMYQDEIDAINAKTDELVTAQTAIYNVGLGMGAFFDDAGNQIAMAAVGLDELALVADRAAPAMEALGYSWAGLASLDDDTEAGRAALAKASQEIERWVTNSETAEGRARNLGYAFTSIEGPMESVADGADRVRAALDELFGPTLGLEEATDAWHTSLQQLRQDLDNVAGFDGYSKAAKMNRDITRQYVTDSTDRLVALAGVATTTERDMVNAVRETRKEFIESGMAAGFSRKEIAARANALGLTPKLVRTVFDAAGIDVATLKAREARKAYLSLPKEVRTALKTEGVPKTVAEVNALVEKYKLTEKERRALISLKDNASAAARAINNLLNEAARDRTSTITVRRNTIGGGVGGGYKGDEAFSADGGFVPKTGKPYADRHPYLLADGEGVTTNRRGETDRFRDVIGGINAGYSRKQIKGMLADGGFAGGGWRSPSSGDNWSGSMSGLATFNDDLRLTGVFLRNELKARQALLTKEQEAGKARLDMLKQEKQALEDSIKARFSADPWGQEQGDGGFGSAIQKALDANDIGAANALMAAQAQATAPNINSFAAVLQQQIADAEEFDQLRKQLVKKGFNGPALNSFLMSATIEEIRAMAAGTRGQIGRIENLYEQRGQSVQQSASSAGNAGWGGAIREQAASNVALRQEFQKLTRQVEALKKALPGAADAHRRGTKREIDEDATRGHKNRRP